MWGVIPDPVHSLRTLAAAVDHGILEACTDPNHLFLPEEIL